MRASEMYLRAGDIIRERGHYKGWYSDANTGRCCLLGACNVVMNGQANDSRNILRNTSSLDDVLLTSAPCAWNDAPGRTEAEVLIALDAAFVLALQEEGEDLDEVFK
jgi:hypothetical protein